MIAWLSTCLLVVVASSETSLGIPADRALGSICKSNDDCLGTANSQCLEGSQGKLECRCRSGHTIDGSLTRCLKVANGYYDTCEDNVQCSEFLGAGGRCDDERRCVCADGYHYLHGRCHQSKGLNEACNSNDDCFVNADYRAASCRRGVCKCTFGYYKREYSTCRPAARKFGDECVIDSDCDFDLNVECVSNECKSGKEMAPRSVRASAEEKDEPTPAPIADNMIIGISKCKVDADCKSIEHSICAVNSTCVCDRGYFASRRVNPGGSDYQDGCVAEIGTVCDADLESDFHVTYSTCKNNTWTCNIDRVASKDNRVCRAAVTSIEGYCQYPEQCQVFGPRSQCKLNRCTCDETSHWVAREKFCWKRLEIGDACEKDYDCYSRGHGFNAICSFGVCKCPGDSEISEDRGYCISHNPELWDYCEKDRDCSKIPHANCRNNSCVCMEKYSKKGYECVSDGSSGLHQASWLLFAMPVIAILLAIPW